MNSKVEWVLLVDDDEIQNFIHQRIISKYLTQDKIYIATNGEEALAILKSQLENQQNTQKGIIFLDINMPIMNGFQFLEKYNRELAGTFAQTTVYPLSSSEDIMDILQMNHLGINNYLVKPLTHEQAGALLK
ncbi:response regulator [Flavobacterium sp.]|uniref:response regulator n=1 Tax=Flavobacterium sp. TaxID=239 RepID=UPI0025C40998|nr:response regulator [Flavobacterium sp.]